MPHPLRKGDQKLERAKGFEPSTPTLARLCSTPELRPLGVWTGDTGPGEGRLLAATPWFCKPNIQGLAFELSMPT
jgi:hypothetical protein